MPSEIKFGTDGWRAIIADGFTFKNVRIAAHGLAGVRALRRGRLVPIDGILPREVEDERDRHQYDDQ